MPKVLLDTTAYVDLERLSTQLQKPWAVNTLRHAATYAVRYGKPYVSTLTVMEIARGFEQELNPAKLQTFSKDHRSWLPVAARELARRMTFK